jgi:hypothetical protein
LINVHKKIETKSKLHKLHELQIMATSSCGSTSSYDYCFFKQFDKRIQAIEYFKGNNVRKTTQLNGWQVT